MLLTFFQGVACLTLDRDTDYSLILRAFLQAIQRNVGRDLKLGQVLPHHLHFTINNLFFIKLFKLLRAVLNELELTQLKLA
jgi:hypothetical protein